MVGSAHRRGVVNAVNVLQAVGFLSRVPTGSMAVNHLLGRVIIALAIPAMAAMIAFVRAGAGWRHWIGPGVYLVFVAFMISVEYVWPVEFRTPMRYGILVPYLVLFFGAILLMGLPMFRMNRALWLVTVATTVLLLGSMGIAMSKGVGCEGKDNVCIPPISRSVLHQERRRSVMIHGDVTVVREEPNAEGSEHVHGVGCMEGNLSWGGDWRPGDGGCRES